MPRTLKGYLRDYGNRPKKSLGQVFLIEPSIQRSILELAQLDTEDTIVEIGPGTGTLTRDILPRVKRLVALEIDRALVSFLRGSMQDSPSFHLVCADALRFDYERVSRVTRSRVKVIGNLPYVISAPLLLTFLEQRKAFSMLVLMLQKEVAQRLTAAQGSRQYGSLSVLCRCFFDIRLARHVSRNCFSPIPNVDSAVLRFVPREAVPIQEGTERLFRSLVRQAFSKRRKTLFNALRSGYGGSLADERLRQALMHSGIEPQRRPETLSPEEYARLAGHIRQDRPLR